MKNTFKRYLQFGALVVVTGCMFASPGMLRADDAATPKNTDKPVLAGPKAERHAKGHGKRFNGRKQHRNIMQESLDSVNLADDQKDQVKTIVVDSRTARKAWQKDHAEELKSIREEVKSARVAKDKEKLTEANTKLKALRADAPKPKDAFDKIRGVLTPDQLTAFDAKIKELRDQAKADNGGMMKGHRGKKHAKDRKASKTKGNAKSDDSQNSKTQDGKLDL